MIAERKSTISPTPSNSQNVLIPYYAEGQTAASRHEECKLPPQSDPNESLVYLYRNIAPMFLEDVKQNSCPVSPIAEQPKV